MRLNLETLWYAKHWLRLLLLPFSWIYRFIAALRSFYLKRFCQIQYKIPVIVIGNLTVGGVGKTPLVIELARQIQQKGLRLGIVSRGYGSSLKHYPYEVQVGDRAEQVGDEPLLLARKSKCPVVIAPERTQAIDYLLRQHKVQVILSDDGLQHYRMGRAIEIAVIDGTRGLGNGLCLPAGPLREKPTRLQSVDFIISNEGSWEQAYPMRLVPEQLRQIQTEESIDSSLITEEVAALSAIGNPHRFYSTLAQLGIKFKTYTYPDHHQFKGDDVQLKESKIIMTEKDAVKCSSFGSEKMYYLPVRAQVSEAFWQDFWSHPALKNL